MSNKPIIGSQIISGKSGSSVSSTAIVQQRLVKQNSTSRLVTTGHVGLVVLLGLASIGVVFTLKHRPERPLAKAPESDPARSVPFVAVNHHVPKGRSLVSTAGKHVRSTARPELLPMPALHREQLAINPNPAVIAASLRLFNGASTGGFLIAMGKSRSDATVEPKEYERPTAAVVDDGRRDNPAAKLAPTDLPGAENRDQTFGTKIKFLTDLPAAWAEAKAGKNQNKLVLLITYGGPFQDGQFVSEKAEKFRRDCLMNDDVADFLQKNGFLCMMQCVKLPKQGPMQTGGYVVSYLCESDKGVLNAIAGPVNAAEFLKEVRWALAVRKKALVEFKTNSWAYESSFRKAHSEKYREGDMEPQNQIHRLLAMTSDRLPSVDKVAPKIYAGIMSEQPLK